MYPFFVYSQNLTSLALGMNRAKALADIPFTMSHQTYRNRELIRLVKTAIIDKHTSDRLLK